MNTRFRRLSKALGVLLVVLACVAPCFADTSDDELDSLLSAPALPVTNVYRNDGAPSEVFAQANALAVRTANIYRDVRYQAYPSNPDAADIKVVCTVTVRDAQSDQELSVIKTAPRMPTGSAQAIPIPLAQVPAKLVSITGKATKDSLRSLMTPSGMSVEVMVQIKRNGASQCTVVVSADSLRGGTCMGVTFVSKDDALPNVTDVGSPAN